MYIIQIVKASMDFEDPVWAIYDETFEDRKQPWDTYSSSYKMIKVNFSVFSIYFIGKA